MVWRVFLFVPLYFLFLLCGHNWNADQDTRGLVALSLSLFLDGMRVFTSFVFFFLSGESRGGRVEQNLFHFELAFYFL